MCVCVHVCVCAPYVVPLPAHVMCVCSGNVSCIAVYVCVCSLCVEEWIQTECQPRESWRGRRALNPRHNISTVAQCVLTVNFGSGPH